MQSELRIAALKACNMFASKEDGRWYLHGVLAQIAARHVLYVATNDHQMLVHREDLAEDAPDNTLLGDFILPRDAIDKLKQRKGEDLRVSLQAFGEGKFLLGDAVIQPVDGTFPQWGRIIPRAVDPEAAHQRPQFNLKYCADFAKASETLGYPMLAPHFHYAEADMPCAITFGEGRQTFGVLMPVRNNADLWAGAPEWTGAAPARPLAEAAE